MAEVLGPDRATVVCRELTKRFEEVLRGSLAALAEGFAGREVKGEIVVLVDRAPEIVAETGDIEAALDAALDSMTVKDAASFVSQSLGVPRKIAYGLALGRKRG
jgi:16S rRNA (cytidine1402-2'-O)-methyltransferase